MRRFSRVCITLIAFFAAAVISLQGQDTATKSPGNPSAAVKSKPRARDLGIPFDGMPGPLNAEQERQATTGNPVAVKPTQGK